MCVCGCVCVTVWKVDASCTARFLYSLSPQRTSALRRVFACNIHTHTKPAHPLMHLGKSVFVCGRERTENARNCNMEYKVNKLLVTVTTHIRTNTARTERGQTTNRTHRRSLCKSKEVFLLAEFITINY